nr:MAG TPA: Quinohemoprotein amine dehydrogenase, alpha subunit domain II [Caudoviricetes sp.]
MFSFMKSFLNFLQNLVHFFRVLVYNGYSWRQV